MTVPVNGLGHAEISDETQMALFTVEGLIAAAAHPEPAGVAAGAAWVACVEGRDTIERSADELADRRIRATPHG